MSPPLLAGLAVTGWMILAVLRSAPDSLTLEQLRSDLSHETAAKLARLSGLVQEWRRGSFRPADAADVQAILGDLERIHLRHARLAGVSFGTLARLARVLRALGRLRRYVSAPRSGSAPGPQEIERFAGLLADLRADCQILCDALSRRHGARFAELVGEAAAEVRSESGHGGPGGIAVLVEGAADVPRSWVPRRDAGMWSDVMRNLIRNAVQATEERGRGGAVIAGTGAADPAGAAAPAASPASGRVTVGIRPMPGRSGTTVEILDEGVGMSAAALAGMWRAGQSRHGAQHGQGLTEIKHAFVEARAGLEVRSVEGVGTCVRVDLPHRDVAIRAPRVWALPPLVAPLLAVIAVVALGATLLAQREIVSIEVLDDTVVRALDAHGGVAWQRDLRERVLPSQVSYLFVRGYHRQSITRTMVIPPRWPWPANVVVATQTSQGPGHLWRLGFRGRTVWKRTLRWAPPRVAHTGDLKSVFQVPVAWNGGGRVAIAANVRDADWSSTAVQFLTLAGDSLGAYYHPGQLEYRAAIDLDGDGREELILDGKNNRAPEDSLFRERVGVQDWLDCLVMLEPPRVDGQAYPYVGWAGLPRAREEGYVLFPPLRPGPAPPGRRANVGRVTFGPPDAPGRSCVEVTLEDGRIYVLDCRLRPLSCGVGSETFAATLAPTRAAAPLLYIHDGICEAIDLPVERGQ